MKKHEFKFTAGQLLGFDLGNPGGCVLCGAEVDGIEPDACEYTCEGCGEPGVYGAQELLFMGLVDVAGD